MDGTKMAGRFRYWGPFKEQWYSICSNHRTDREDCTRCSTGMWENIYLLKIRNYFCKHHYKIWYWWVNRKGSKSRKFLEKTFPRLRFKG